MRLKVVKGGCFITRKTIIPSYDELIFIANSKHHDKEAIRRFLKAIELGVQYIVNNPEKSWDIFKNYSPKQLNNELNHRAWFDTVARFDLRPAAKDANRYQTFADFLYNKKEIKNRVNSQDLMLELY